MSFTPTINPHIKRPTESFLVISPPSGRFHLWSYKVIGKTVCLSIIHVVITNEEMARGYLLLETIEEVGEVGLSTRSSSEIERNSILALGNADAR